MSAIKVSLQARKKELEELLRGLKPLQDELKEVERLLKTYEPKKEKKTCTGCYYVPRDSRDGEPSGGCDECRQGPHYR